MVPCGLPQDSQRSINRLQGTRVMRLRLPTKWTGFRIMVALAAILLGAGVCNAGPITYQVNQTIRGDSVIGTIQTDGTTGVLGQVNFIAWNLDLNGVGATFNITNANRVVFLTGSDVTATATDLFFDFSASDGGFLLFQQGLSSGAHYYCDASSAGACLQGASVTPQTFADLSFQNAAAAGSQVIGTAASIPEPATLALFGAGLTGLGLMRCRRSA